MNGTSAAVPANPTLRARLAFAGSGLALLAAIFLCPAGLVVGAIGGLASVVRRRPTGSTIL